ncbi:hypothetical protein BCR35DRAFT_301490 [Leucosporidium creatinivorum]|uniref:Rhodanese domain-containing protein n=1 Tax=Leucosporidium creatinivorum TaxID=106004 RepID=A0A1Y2FYV1_9BASI|nr:hypothetical protein BCR35DRAFT_301490 [Leucosporidium creatinivorum]
MAYRYIDHSELAQLMRSGAQPGRDYQVVDVRDHDFVGGNITGALNQPSEQRTEQTVSELVSKLDGIPKVIFHCALSQVRGPKAARIYAEARSAASSSPSPSLNSPAPTTSTTSPPPSAGGSSAASAFAPNPFAPAPAAKTEEGAPSKSREQEVLVLRDGFEGWQSLYRKDPLLVEKFDESLWGSYSA